MIEFSVPVRVKKSKNKWFVLNMNEYRNAHHRTLANAKKDYHHLVPIDLIRQQTHNTLIINPIRVHYRYYPNSARLYDRMNIASVLDKFLMDVLVKEEIIKDDNYKLVLFPTFEHGGIEKEARMDVSIEVMPR